MSRTAGDLRAAVHGRAGAAGDSAEARDPRSVQHLIGYLKKELSSEGRQELLGLIED